MAKRFTDTNKYKKQFISGLPGAYKLLWDYLYHDCDHAGIWIVNFKTAQIFIGEDMPVDMQQALRLFNSDEQRIIEIDGGKKWFIPSFIEFQYGRLSEKNRAHISVISILNKYNLINEDLEIKPLTSPLQGAKDKEQDKEQEMDMDKDKETTPPQKFLIPEMQKIFNSKNIHYLPNKELDYRPLLKIAQFISAQENIEFQNRAPDGEKRILEIWSEMSGFISDHKFYGTKSLSTISNQIQAICLEYGKPATGKKSNKSLDEAFAEYYSQGG